MIVLLKAGLQALSYSCPAQHEHESCVYPIMARKAFYWLNPLWASRASCIPVTQTGQAAAVPVAAGLAVVPAGHNGHTAPASVEKP
jgi:hypothetical protein